MTYARTNLEAREGTLSGEETLTLARKSRQLQITNDSASNMMFKFHASENWGTLGPTETLSVEFSARQVILNGSGAYRVWSWG